MRMNESNAALNLRNKYRFNLFMANCNTISVEQATLVGLIDLTTVEYLNDTQARKETNLTSNWHLKPGHLN